MLSYNTPLAAPQARRPSPLNLGGSSLICGSSPSYGSSPLLSPIKLRDEPRSSMTPPSPASFSPFRPLPDPFAEDISTGPPKARLRIRPVQSASTRQVRRRPGCCTHSPCPISGPTDVRAATFLHSQPIPLRRRRGDVNAPRDTFDITVMCPGPVRRRRHVPKDPYRLRPRYMEHHHEMASSAFPLIDDLDFGVPPRTPMHSQMGSGIPMQPVRFYDLMPVWSTIHA